MSLWAMMMDRFIHSRFEIRGNRARRLLLGLFVAACTVPLHAQQEPEVRVRTSSNSIYEGESFEYEVTLSNLDNSGPPQLQEFDDFDVKPNGQSSVRSQDLRRINGKLTMVTREEQVYSFILTPKRSGRLTIPSPTAEVDGEIYKGRSLTIEVVPPQDQDTVIVQLSTSRQHVYPLQPFDVTLTVAVRALPPPFEDRNPVNLLRGAPTLSIPWADDERLPANLEPETSHSDWLRGLINSRGTGFGINNFSSAPSLLSFSMIRDRLVFQPPARRTTRTDSRGQETAYWEFDFQRTFQSSEVADFTFGPVTLKGDFIVGVRDGDRADLEAIYTIAPAVQVAVIDVPQTGRPASYTGAIGEFKISGELVPDRAKVGDPLTLTITVRGKGTLDNATAPDLTAIPEVTEQFRVYDEPTEETRRGERRFTYGLRPLHEGKISVPPIPLSYFDVQQEKYVTLRTDELPIQVEAAQELGAGEIALSTQPNSRNRGFEVQQDGILANVDDPMVALRDESISAPSWFAGIGCLAGLYGFVALLAGRIQQLLGDTLMQRRRAAPGRARQRLRDALSEIEQHELRRAADHVGDALIGLVADVTGTDEAGLTSDEAGRRLAELNVDPELVKRLTVLLQACDGARYGASEGDLHGLEGEANSLLEDLLTTLRKKKLV